MAIDLICASVCLAGKQRQYEHPLNEIAKWHSTWKGNIELKSHTIEWYSTVILLTLLKSY